MRIALSCALFLSSLLGAVSLRITPTHIRRNRVLVWAMSPHRITRSMATTRVLNSILRAKKSSKASSLPLSPSPRKHLVSHGHAATAARPQSFDLPSSPTTPKTTKQKTTSPVVIHKNEIFSDDGFCDLQVPPAELRPSATLTTGQCFHWTAVSTNDTTTSSAWGSHNATEWIGTVRTPSGDSAVVVLRELPDTVHYKVLTSTHASNDWDARTYLQDYFQLDSSSLAQLYADWSEQCPRMRRIADSIPGVRILDQDPWECLVSFLCSSNNNIPRITQMLQAIRREYGAPLAVLDDDSTVYYSFPSLSELMAQATEQDLRQRCGLGYRAKYLMETMQLLSNLGGESYLHSLRGVRDPAAVSEALMQFCGVGRKVADCVALFSLRQDQAIPVDVHVWHIARRDYYNDTHVGVKSLTPTIYRQVGDVFRERFKVKSGWAHSLLFVAELPSFRSALPADVLEEMDKVGDWRLSTFVGACEVGVITDQ